MCANLTQKHRCVCVCAQSCLVRTVHACGERELWTIEWSDWNLEQKHFILQHFVTGLHVSAASPCITKLTTNTQGMGVSRLGGTQNLETLQKVFKGGKPQGRSRMQQLES